MTLAVAEPPHTPFAPALAVVPPDARAAVDELAAGRVVAVVDLCRPEAGGCLVAAAEHVTAEAVNAMLVHARGTPWLALPEQRCLALGLRPFGTPRPWEFQISIEARRGVTTGVSAADRALTMRVAASPDSTAAHIIEPGHVMPIRVPDDAILLRAGVVDAAVELALAAGTSGGAAICWILDEDGDAAPPAAIERLAGSLGIRVATTLDALDVRMRSEPAIVRERDEPLATLGGAVRAVTFGDRHGAGRHLALVQGAPATGAPALVTVHEQDPLGDVFGAGDAPSRRALESALARGAGTPAAVLLYVAAPRIAEPAADDPAAAARTALLRAKRTAHVVTHILEDLGIDTVRVAEHEADAPGAADA
ncbi:MAG: 3,4-dihydroxy 2-butanone 4-phosphate synthase / cyclohydrolase [Solirubrobacteraceae bacterium]|nr:3,4-dihydroxy 2-butanone 4-phosphate synthase / cyclohydrolase [Solirubrobacteraceae bacterium]